MFKKLKTVSLSILPILALVLILHFTVYKFSDTVITSFLIGVALFIVGQVVFLTGLDNSIVPMGEFVGNSINNGKRFYIYIIFGLVFGIVSTLAEPDLQVFSSKVILAGFAIPKLVLLIGAGVGVGLFLALGLASFVSKVPLHIAVVLIYLLIIVLGFFVEQNYFGMALDIGASTTGVITSPFLLALGIGVAKICSYKSNSTANNFGLIGISSAGPVVIILIMSMLLKNTNASVTVEAVSSLPLWVETLKDVALSLLPLYIVFFVFEVLFIKISKQEKKKLLFGSFITFIGFYLFLFSVEFGFSAIAVEIGHVIASFNNIWISIIICALLAFSLVFSEPSIRIFAKEIETVTNRNIKSWLIIVSIAISIVLSIITIIIKIYLSIPMWIITTIFYGIVFILSIVVNKMFTAIAFDSSGVATGTLTVALIFPIIAGVAGDGASGFGTLGIMTMMPIFVMELVGLAYTLTVKVETRRTRKILLRLSRTEDQFSNIDAIRLKHEREFEGVNNG